MDDDRGRGANNRTNNGHHVTRGAITLHLANPVRVWCHVKGGDI